MRISNVNTGYTQKKSFNVDGVKFMSSNNRLKNNVKLVATDIDGTLVPFWGEFGLPVKNCIANLIKNNIKVVLVTGRMNSVAKDFAKKIGLETPVISYQGGLVTHKDDVLYERYLTEMQANSIINWSKEENIHLNFYNNDNLYSEKDDYEVQEYCRCLHTKYEVKDFSDVSKDKVNKILAIDYKNPDRISLLEKKLQSKFNDVYVVKSSPYLLEFCNLEATKAHAVKFLQEYWNIQKDETLTIGDQNNDIPLLKAGGIKVAMGNATEELKCVADYVTDTVQNDGFVKAIEKFCGSFIS